MSISQTYAHLKSEHPRLDRPPIVEAILDFSVVNSDSFEPEALQLEAEKVFGEGAEVSPIRTHEAQLFLAEAGTDVSTRSGIVGFRYQDSAANRVAQFRTDGMTFSMVGDYSTWDQLQKESLQALNVFQKAIGLPVPIRLATRFINRMWVPLGSDLAHYFRTLPPLPVGADGVISSFRTHTQIVDSDDLILGSLTLMSEDVTDNQEEGSIVVDVSAGSNRSFTIGIDVAPSELALEDLRKIRSFKNKLFFGSLTPYALNSYRDEQ